MNLRNRIRMIPLVSSGGGGGRKVREFRKFATLAARRFHANAATFLAVGGGGVRGDSAGQGAFRAPESKWKFLHM